MNFFLLNFLNLMSCKNRNRVMLVNVFFKIFSQFFKIRVECPFNAEMFCVGGLNAVHPDLFLEFKISQILLLAQSTPFT